MDRSAGRCITRASFCLCSESDLVEGFGGVAEGAGVDSAFVHHGEVETAHLAVWLVAVVEDSAAFDSAAAAAEEDDGEL